MFEEFGSTIDCGVGTRTGHSFTIILVLFILLVIIGSATIGRW